MAIYLSVEEAILVILYYNYYFDSPDYFHTLSTILKISNLKPTEITKIEAGIDYLSKELFIEGIRRLGSYSWLDSPVRILPLGIRHIRITNLRRLKQSEIVIKNKELFDMIQKVEQQVGKT